MRSNKLIETAKSRKPIINGWLTLGSPAVAELMAHQPWDSLTIDMQHGFADFETVVHMLRAISTTDTVPLVRPPQLDSGLIGRLLDAGAYGVICPMINTEDQCRKFVQACRYAPAGARSFGPTRATLYAGSDYPKHANENILALAMIETREALDNLESIINIEGLSGVYIGPADLSLSLGFDPIHDQTHPDLLAAYERILNVSTQAGKLVSMHCGTLQMVEAMSRFDFPMLTVSNDSRLIVQGAGQLFEQLG